MNWLDVAIVLIVAGFTVSAYRAGLIRELVTLSSVLIGIVLAGLLYDDLARDVIVFVDDDDAARAIAFLVLLGSAFLAGQLIAIMLRQVAALLLLGWADRAGGALFGAFKGIVVVEILLILFVTYPQLGLDNEIDGSGLATAFLDAGPALLLVLPGEFERAVEAFPPAAESALQFLPGLQGG